MITATSVRVVRTRLQMIRAIRSLLQLCGWGVGVWLILAALHPVASMSWLTQSLPARWAAVCAVVGAAAVIQRRGAAALSPSHTALWIEEQGGVPPDFSLVTWLEQGEPRDGALAAAAAERLRNFEDAPAWRRILVAQWRAPLVFLSGAVSLLMLTQRDPAYRQSPLLRSEALASEPRTVGPTLDPWRVEVVAPAYTKRRAADLGNATSVRALTGSRIIVRGAHRGRDEQAPNAQLRGVGERRGWVQDVRVDVVRESWTVATAVPEDPVTMVVSRESTVDTVQRLLIIENIPDSIPIVALQKPARDSVFRKAEGVIPLVASVGDDIALATARFDVVITSGEGERFTVRSVAVGARSWSASTATTRAVITGSLDLGALGLLPGDVLHVRALAGDHHPASDREFGSSETRAFRIARASEYDSVAVEPAPPPAVDSSLLSQRMLLLLTQKLDRRQRAMPRSEVVRESQRIARDQARLRRAVGDVVFQRLSGESSAEHAHSAGDGHDHGVDLQEGKLTLRSNAGMLDEGNDGPVIAVSQPLLEAYNAMWDAGRALEQGDPHGAIPPMQRALEAIERSRAASRLYLRGRPPQVIVDIAKVRLTGRDTGQSSPRTMRTALSRRVAERDARLVRLVSGELTGTALRDSLALLRIEAIADAPAFAAALAAALDALGNGRDLTPALIRARRTLGVVSPIIPGAWTRGVPR